MESLSETRWDVVIEGTGLQQSLLALALSRSDKKVLHLDRNEYYGGSDAAFSLLEAEEWAKKLAETPSYPFSHTRVSKPVTSGPSKLASSRAYTLTLSPQLVYSKSKLLNQLVSSQVYRQLEFQAVGNWWICQDASDESQAPQAEILKRMPNGREDIFSDRSIDVRSKRGLVKFLKFVIDFENQPEIWEKDVDSPLTTFMASHFQLPDPMQKFILALTLSLDEPSQTTVGYSLPRIARHLTSIGVFGPGFGSVLAKWGGGAEIAQIACRAGAVGGAVYVLGTGVEAVRSNAAELALTNGETIRTAYYVCDQQCAPTPAKTSDNTAVVSRSITVVSTPMAELFKTTVEGAPIGAVAVIAFPPGSLIVQGKRSTHPVYVMAHSSETGECPQDQCILYASTKNVQSPKERLDAAVALLLKAAFEAAGLGHTAEPEMEPEALFELYYDQSRASASTECAGAFCGFPSPSVDLAFDDSILDNVEEAWRHVADIDENAAEEAPYMVFTSREHYDDDDE